MKLIFKEWSVSALMLAVVLTACDGPSKKPTKNIDVDISQKENIGLGVSLESVLEGVLPIPLTEYTFDTLIKSTNLSENSEHSETMPFMPFLIGGLACYQLKGEYKFVGQSKEYALGGQPSEWTRFTVINNGFVTNIFINGVQEIEIEDDGALKGAIVLGKGYLNRNWGGDVKYFDVYAEAKSPIEFSASVERLSGDRVYSLDMLAEPN